MTEIMLFLRSLLFNIGFFGWNILSSLLWLWLFVLPRDAFWRFISPYFRVISWLEENLIPLKLELRNWDRLPDGPCIIAAKHQSAYETLKLPLLLDRPAIILKKELMYIPIWGWYAAKLDMIAIERGGGRRAIRSMVEGARRMYKQGRPIVIFPQGTRLRPGHIRPYKWGVAKLYEELNLPVYPLALNSGVFWPRKSFLKKPGTVVMEFLEPIEPGLPADKMLERLEYELESASNRLACEAGGPPAPLPGSDEWEAERPRRRRSAPRAGSLTGEV